MQCCKMRLFSVISKHCASLKILFIASVAMTLELFSYCSLSLLTLYDAEGRQRRRRHIMHHSNVIWCKRKYLCFNGFGSKTTWGIKRLSEDLRRKKKAKMHGKGWLVFLLPFWFLGIDFLLIWAAAVVVARPGLLHISHGSLLLYNHQASIKSSESALAKKFFVFPKLCLSKTATRQEQINAEAEKPQLIMS